MLSIVASYPLMNKGYKKKIKRQNKHENERQIFEIADSQQGFFTAKQAIDAGYSEKNHAFHVRSGSWIRELHGVYRLRSYPKSMEADLVLWSLWSRGKDGIPQGVYSHETVLSHFELSDVNPARLHLTVPVRFKRRAYPQLLALHRTDLKKGDIQQMKGYSMTTVKRALEDVVREGKLSHDLIEQAISVAYKTGYLKITELEGSSILDPYKAFLQKERKAS